MQPKKKFFLIQDTLLNLNFRQRIGSFFSITVFHDLVLCDSLEGWNGMGGGRDIQEGGDILICIRMVDSRWCTAEINTIL